MKYFVFLIMCLINYSAVSFGFNLNDSCFVKSGLKLENVRNLMLNGEPGSQEENCFLGCFWKKINTMNADNTLNVKQMQENFQPIKKFNEELHDSFVEVYETCDTETKSEVVNVDECEAANIISKCIFPKLKKIQEEAMSKNTPQ